MSENVFEAVANVRTEKKHALDVSSQTGCRVVGKKEDQVVNRFQQRIERAAEALLGDEKHHELVVVGAVIDKMFHRLGESLQVV